MWRIDYDKQYLERNIQEWWIVTDGNRHFKCDSEADANWLLDLLTKQA